MAQYRNCSNCGSNILDTATHCPKCGARQPPPFTDHDFDKNPYEVLQVAPGAEPEVIEAAYRTLSKKYHPDASGHPHSQERMKDVNWAYSILRDPERAKEWETSSREGKRTASASQPRPFREEPAPPPPTPPPPPSPTPTQRASPRSSSGPLPTALVGILMVVACLGLVGAGALALYFTGDNLVGWLMSTQMQIPSTPWQLPTSTPGRLPTSTPGRLPTSTARAACTCPLAKAEYLSTLVPGQTVCLRGDFRLDSVGFVGTDQEYTNFRLGRATVHVVGRRPFHIAQGAYAEVTGPVWSAWDPSYNQLGLWLTSWDDVTMCP